MASYVYGTAVRKEAVQPNQRPVEHTKEVSQRVRQNRNRALHMNRGYVMFLAVAAMIALFSCVQYLQLQSEITSRSEHITELQRELAERREANTTKYNVVINSMNLEEIRERAMNDLGMVYATQENVVLYKKTSQNYVSQYDSVPQEETSLIKSIIMSK